MSHNSLLELKIMKLFLLNTIENQELRKIGLVFLAFFSKSRRKRKQENMNSRRAEFGLSRPSNEENARPRAPHTVGFAETPLPVQKSERQSSALFKHLTDTLY
jgi:hypothetical protein